MDTQKVVFMNKELGLRLAGLLRLPEGFDLKRNYPAVVITGPMLSVKEQAQSVYAKRLTEAGYVTLVFDGSYFGESEGLPRGQELPDVKESDIEGAVDYLVSLPYVDKDRIGGLGICGSGSYMSVAGVKEPRIKAVTAIVPAISDISTSPMMGFFKPEEEVKAAKEKREPMLLPNFSVHYLRHTFCTRFCENETNVKVIQAVMGHKNFKTTMDVYAEATGTKKQEAMQSLSAKWKEF